MKLRNPFSLSHDHTVQVVRNTITVLLPRKNAPDDSTTATYMYVNGWNDAMARASELIAELRLGAFEPVAKDRYVDPRDSNGLWKLFDSE